MEGRGGRERPNELIHFWLITLTLFLLRLGNYVLQWSRSLSNSPIEFLPILPLFLTIPLSLNAFHTLNTLNMSLTHSLWRRRRDLLEVQDSRGIERSAGVCVCVCACECLHACVRVRVIVWRRQIEIAFFYEYGLTDGSREPSLLQEMQLSYERHAFSRHVI